MLVKAEARVQHEARRELVNLVQAAAAGVAIDRIAVPAPIRASGHTELRRDALGVIVMRIALRQSIAESDHAQLIVLAELKVETADE